jgi:UDP-glucose 4-epimerase
VTAAAGGAAAARAGCLAWVVGQGGLLGAQLARQLDAAEGIEAHAEPPIPATACWSPPGPGFSWSAPQEVGEQLDRAAAAFFAAVAAGGHRSWCVFWAAGAGIVGSTPAALGAESAILAHALDRIAAHRDRIWPRPEARPAGLVVLASSAGGVYGRCPDSPATEASPCLPISDYGREKLRQEGQLCTWAAAHGIGHLVGRISNLYGPGQNLGKPQGLITHLVRSLVLDQPVHLYVSLDTLRDYIHVDDCARAIVGTAVQLLDQAARGPVPGVVKIFASEQATSISAVIGIISRVTRRRPRVVYAAPLALGEQQPRRLTFRSTVLPQVAKSSIGLPVGISQIHQHLLERFRAGQLAPARRLV